MKRITTLVNLSRPDAMPIQVFRCSTYQDRLLGFMFRRRLGLSEGLLLVQKKENRLDASIHMLAVFTKLAVFWINSSGLIVDRVLALPWRPVYFPRSAARYVLEIHPSRLDEFLPGEQVKIHDD